MTPPVYSSAILASLFLASLLIAGAARSGVIKEPRVLLFFVLTVFTFSLLPSMTISYLIDDTDHIYHLAMSTSVKDTIQWLFLPHNEHVMPLIKALYLLAYKAFGINPLPFHVFIILATLGIIYFTYRLIHCLTDSHLSALMGSAILAASNLCNLAIFVICDSHILFCLFLFLALFCLQFEYYRQKGSRKILFLIFLSTVFLPSTFALGLTSIVFAPLFEFLCIPQSLRKKIKNTFFTVLTGWLLSLGPYFYSIDKILYSPHYRDLGQNSVLGIINIPAGFLYLAQYIYRDLIPQLIADNSYLSVSLFGVVVALIIYHHKRCPWKAAIFFLLFGLFNNLIIYASRISWNYIFHADYTSYDRYNVFPAFSLAVCYALIIRPALKNLDMRSSNLTLFVVLACLAAVSLGGSLRYTKAEFFSWETSQTIQKFYEDFPRALKGYYTANDEKKFLVRNAVIILPEIKSLKLKSGRQLNMTRYNRPAQFYSNLLLPKEIRENIIWGATSDKEFLSYLKSQKRFSYLGELF